MAKKGRLLQRQPGATTCHELFQRWDRWTLMVSGWPRLHHFLVFRIDAPQQRSPLLATKENIRGFYSLKVNNIFKTLLRAVWLPQCSEMLRMYIYLNGDCDIQDIQEQLSSKDCQLGETIVINPFLLIFSLIDSRRKE
ncbi:hypothetical protein WN51_12592 [Melipona quadrifasciata]|uniref:Uncharacterized protein n=1 Tax=Melipona quadrifasciata TaxID=166423 RepID=A0A0N0BH66_9HYME|nr:hypothetical protein WN51_12592 [Melipona quadrifasciata]